ncbi:MAG TPA: hypothetical protein VLE51_02490 [Candidatus Saccharimonadales bacterium]|nr:hypothetical protein [Candidatus Saccharimonadales bacterium]
MNLFLPPLNRKGGAKTAGCVQKQIEFKLARKRAETSQASPRFILKEAWGSVSA